MTALLLVLTGLLGLSVGSFLNVVVYRVPAEQSVVRPASACPQCAVPIRARDNIPVLSWVLLHGRCRDCGAPISPRYPVIEILGAALFVTMALRFGLSPVLPAYLYLAAVGLALAAIDIDTHRLPDRLTLPSYPVAIALLAVALAGTGSLPMLGRACLAGIVMYCLYFALCFAYPAGMGFGDVKLAGLVGLYTGWVGWAAWGVGLFLGFAYGAVFGVALMLFGRGGRKTRVPYGPFLLAGALTGILAGNQIAHAYLSLASG